MKPPSIELADVPADAVPERGTPRGEWHDKNR